jgi:transposase
MGWAVVELKRVHERGNLDKWLEAPAANGFSLQYPPNIPQIAWVTELLDRRPAKVVAVALADKMARTAWAMLAGGESYRVSTHSSGAAIAAAA